ncbi:MAG: hypothetical protein ACREID_04425, partial [Planctomycetota bacterium]
HGRWSLDEAWSRGEAVAWLVPEPGETPLGIEVEEARSWRLDLRGPARLAGEAVAVERGASFRVVGEEDKAIATGDVGHLRIELERAEGRLRARRVEGTEGVSVGDGEQSLEARRLSYEHGTSRLRLEGAVELRKKGSKRMLRMKSVEVSLARHGLAVHEGTAIEVVEEP